MLREQEKLPSRTKAWWEHQHVSWAHNRTMAPSQVRQYGGCALFSINKAAHRACEKGCDGSNLGRWVWTRYKGWGNQSLCIITAYRPNPPQGPFSVYAQHNAHFNSIRRDISPRQAFICDLILEIQKFLDLGDHLILMLNGNSNMKNSDLSKSLSQLSLSEAILGRHGNDGLATHKRSSTGTPIDGIWFSPGLEIQKGGYLEYDAMLQSDHQCLWVDLSFQNAFGHNMAPIHKNQARRLHFRDPRLVQNYTHLYHQLAYP
jgi:exonuclease III